MSTLVGGTGIIGQDIFCSFGNGKYTTFEGTEISIENCLKAKVKDLRVEGKTYQNLVSNLDKLVGNIYTKKNEAKVVSNLLKVSTTYTFIINISEANYSDTNFGAIMIINYPTLSTSYVNISKKNGIFKVRYTIKEEIPKNILISPHANNDTSSSFKLENLIILEGDYTNIDIPNSINGIESVAERESINLLENVEWYDGFINMDTGEIETSTSYPKAKYSELIEINSNQLYKTNITENINGLRIRLYKADGSFIRNSGTLYSFNGLYRSGINYFSKIRLLVLNAEQYPLPITPYVIANDENINYPYPLKLKVNEKINPINLPIPLRSLPNGVADTIEGDKLVKRVGKVVLNGTQAMTLANVNQTKTTRVRIVMDNAKISNKNNLICNWYIRTGAHGDYEYIIIQDSSVGICLFISVSNSKLDTVDLNGIEKYFKENPLPVYYELAEPIIHDLTVPQLSTAKGTNIITTSNNIKPKISMKVKVKKNVRKNRKQ